MLKRCCGWLICLALALSSSTATAFTISPTVILLDARTPERHRVTIAASLTAPLALELQILERHADGAEENLTPPLPGAPGISSPQVFIPPGETANLVLNWDGMITEVKSRSFYLVAEELPVELTPNRAAQSLRFLARIHLPVHIDNGGKPSLQARVLDQTEIRRVEITNLGSRYARFSELELHVGSRSNETSRTIPGLELARHARVDAILPGRVIVLDADELGLEPEERFLELAERR